MTKHDRQWLTPILVCVATLLASPVMAQSIDDLDVTMRMVVDEDDLTNSVVREIELPEPMLQSRDRSQGTSADPVRPERPDLETALDAMERGQEIGDTASERASEAREIIESERPADGGLLDSLPEGDNMTDLPGIGDLTNDANELLDGVGDHLDPESP